MRHWKRQQTEVSVQLWNTRYCGLQEFLTSGNAFGITNWRLILLWLIHRLLAPLSTWKKKMSCVRHYISLCLKSGSRMEINTPEKLCIRLCCHCRIFWLWTGQLWNCLIMLALQNFATQWITRWNNSPKLALFTQRTRHSPSVCNRKNKCGDLVFLVMALLRNWWILYCIWSVFTSHWGHVMNMRTWRLVVILNWKSKLILRPIIAT